MENSPFCRVVGPEEETPAVDPDLILRLRRTHKIGRGRVTRIKRCRVTTQMLLPLCDPPPRTLSAVLSPDLSQTQTQICNHLDANACSVCKCHFPGVCCEGQNQRTSEFWPDKMMSKEGSTKVQIHDLLFSPSAEIDPDDERTKLTWA